PVTAVAIAPDGSRIAWGTADPCPELAACPEVMAPLELAMQLPVGDWSVSAPAPLRPEDQAMLRAELGAAGYGLLAARSPVSEFDASELMVIGPAGPVTLTKTP